MKEQFLLATLILTAAAPLAGQSIRGRVLVAGDTVGVEVYRTRFENVEGYWPSTCGIVFMWRKPDWGHPFTWGSLFIAIGFTSLAWAISLIF